MKTPDEIRSLRNALLVAIEAPCDCRRNGHEPQCIQGIKMMMAVAVNLTWVLGENDGHQAHVDEMIRRAAEITGGN